LNLSPQKKHYLAIIVCLVALVVFGFLAIQTNSPSWAIGMLAAGAAYAFWNMMFSCPVCGTPYLYESKGIFVVPLQFPKRCKKCGHPTTS
jgi:hypothetical protein